MTSWGMNQPKTCSNCSIQLGNQICNLTRSVGATIAPCLYLFVCEAEQCEEKRRTQEWLVCVCVCLSVGEGVCVLSGASLSPSHPWANPSGGTGQARPSHSPRTKPSHARHAQLYLSAACLLILICKEAILSPLANWVSQWAADFFEVTVGKYA